MDYSLLKKLLRLPDVKRWTIVKTVSDQNVAEHSFRVAAIAARIAAKIPESTVESVHRAYFWASLHDVAEEVTGDAPSPVKQALKRAGVDFDSLSDAPATPESIKWIVKAADYIEQIQWITENAGCNPRTRLVRDDILCSYSGFLSGLPHDCVELIEKVRHEVDSSDTVTFKLDFKDA